MEEVPPSLISPLVTGTEPVDPSTYVTFFRPWTQALECTRRGHGLLRERHVVGPRVPAAQWRGPAIAARGGPLRGYSGPLRGLTSRAAYIAAPRRGHDVVPLYAAQVSDTRPKFLMKPSGGVDEGLHLRYGPNTWNVASDCNIILSMH